MLLAAESLSRAAAPPIVNLRVVNPYVAAALSDWQLQKGLTPQAPRQLSPAPLTVVCAQKSLARHRSTTSEIHLSHLHKMEWCPSLVNCPASSHFVV